MQVVGFAKDNWYPHPLEQVHFDSSYALVKKVECEKNSFLMNFKHSQTFCATANEEAGKAVHIQDLGSGLYMKKDDKWFIGGILSKASATDSLVIFTDVFQYSEWIRKT